MTAFIFVLIGFFVASVFYGVMLYNGLVQVKHNVDKSWANIDVILKQRHDEIPKLVEVCQQYKGFEEGLIQKVVAARAAVYNASRRGDVKAVGIAEGALKAGMSRLFALAEAYPDLKASQNYVQLQQRISALEDALSDRREFYNESVNINNIKIEQFPDAIVAGVFNFKARPLLEFSEAEKADVDIKKLFAS